MYMFYFVVHLKKMLEYNKLTVKFHAVVLVDVVRIYLTVSRQDFPQLHRHQFSQFCTALKPYVHSSLTASQACSRFHRRRLPLSTLNRKKISLVS